MSQKIKYPKLRLKSGTSGTLSQENDTTTSQSIPEKNGIETIVLDDIEEEEPEQKRTRRCTELEEGPKKAVIKLATENKTNDRISDEFEPKTVIKKAPAMEKPKARKRTRKTQTDIRKVFKKREKKEADLMAIIVEQSAADNVDPDELQTALALSRSMMETETSQQTAKAHFSRSSASASTYTLEQFGFQTKSRYNDYNSCMIFEKTPVRKRGKYNRISLLVKRTIGDNARFIANKLKQLFKTELKENNVNFKEEELLPSTIHSSFLKDYCDDSCRLWNISKNSLQTDICLEAYYVNCIFEKSLVKSGYLLKDWSLIPGRELSPTREELEVKSVEHAVDFTEKIAAELDLVTIRWGKTKEEENVSTSLKHTETERETSPDLFASSDDADSVKEMPIVLTTKNTVSKDAVDSDVSCDNIFEDSDPMINYEMYTSEEVKIPDAENNLTGKTVKTDVETIELSSGSSCVALEDKDDYQLRDCQIQDRISMTMPNIEVQNLGQFIVKTKRSKSNCMSPNYQSTELILFPSPTNFSDECIIPRVEKKPSVIEEQQQTTNIKHEEYKTDETIEISELELEMDANLVKSPSQSQLHDNALDISDDEINYSMRKQHKHIDIYDVDKIVDYTKISPGNVNSSLQGTFYDSDVGCVQDLDITDIYYSPTAHQSLLSKTIRYSMNVSASQPNNVNNQDACDVHLISSEDELNDGDELLQKESNDTLAYLDKMVEKYNLPVINNTRNDVIITGESSNKKAKLSSSDLDEEIENIFSHQLNQNRSKQSLQRTVSDSVLIKKAPQNNFQKIFAALNEAEPTQTLECSIRIGNVTPKPDYESMSETEVERELFKYGIKLLSKPKAIKMLSIIYDRMHPYVNILDDNPAGRVEEPVVELLTPVQTFDDERNEKGTDLVFVDGFYAEIENEEYILPSKPRKKIHWTPVPLNIAFYNMVKSNPSLRLDILKYKPIDLNGIFKQLQKIGLRYEPKDLISFFDKRCIIFKNEPGSNNRNKKT